ncbi:hypothetical protein SK128_018365 [Halocaridina rubra]|uniref:DNA polymerase kappa n=1 Tax=Halocaridina rubra TaxID=373956 RepID=A0AAN9AA72_HALRR
MAPQTLALNTHKAGMEGLDVEKINEILQKASEGSKFYHHKQKCQKRLDAKISEMLKFKSALTEEQIKKATLQMDRLIEELESSRDLTRTIVHVDMDMFYAAVEMRDDPNLRDKPMAVGGTGMLSTSNYAARKFGVRAAMPGFIGKKLCPELVIVPPDFTKYKAASKTVQEVFGEYDPNFCMMSLDEGYLDITDYIHDNGSRYSEYSEDDVSSENVASAIVREMRAKIQEKTQLTASAGIAPNTRLAKVCSDMNKPNGQFYLPPNREKILEFVATLPIRKVSGIGNVMEQQLKALEINVCSDLMEKRGPLRLIFSDLNYNHFLMIALGISDTRLDAWTERERKSISTETTFRGTNDRSFLVKQTEDLCRELVEDLIQKDILGKIFTLKIKTTDFQIKTRAHTFPEATCSLDVLMSTARRLLQHEMDASAQPLSLRLIGVRMSNLMSSAELGPSRQVTLTQMFSKSLSRTSQERKFSDSSTSSDTTKNLSEISGNHTRNTTTESKVSLSEKSCSFDKNNSKQRVTNKNFIEKFLVKSPMKLKPPKMKYDCPVCFQEIEVDSLDTINTHVDKCLESKTSSQVSGSSPVNVVPTDIEVIDICESDIAKHDSDEWKCKGNAKHVLCNNSLRERELGKNTKTSIDVNTEKYHSEGEEHVESAREKQALLCPVCKSESFENELNLNCHLDECLSLRTINDIMQSSTSPRMSHTSNDAGTSFFRTVQNYSQVCKPHPSDPPRKKQKISHNKSDT